jgi:hypothetical protein
VGPPVRDESGDDDGVGLGDTAHRRTPPHDARKTRHTGEPVATAGSTAVRFPVPASRRKRVIESLRSFAQNNHVPVGSRVKNRGPFPPVVVHAGAASSPVTGSTVNRTMVSWPRFEA